jgi:hypothetical protein
MILLPARKVERFRWGMNNGRRLATPVESAGSDGLLEALSLPFVLFLGGDHHCIGWLSLGQMPTRI